MDRPDRLRILLVALGRDQQQLARAAGVSPGTLSRALRGERRLSVGSRRRLAEALADAMLEQVTP